MTLRKITALLLSAAIIMTLGLAGCKKDAKKTESKVQASKNESVESKKDVTDSENESSADVTDSSEQDSSSADTPSAGDKKQIATSYQFKPLTASGDAALQSNPDRGFRTHVVYFLDQAVASGDPITYFHEKYSGYCGGVDMPFTVSLIYVYLTEYRDGDIPPEAMKALEELFEFARIKNFKMALRFCYCDDWNNLNTGADQATIIKHIRQLAPVVSKNKDTIHSIENGFVGAYGEWAPCYQVPAVDYETVMRAIVKYLCIPNGLFFSSRLPSYKNLIPKNDPMYRWIAHNNDAMYGETTNEGWHSGDLQIGNGNGMWEQVCAEGAYTPQGGEMLVNDSYKQMYAQPAGIDLIKECAHHWHSLMSIFHCYYEVGGQENAVMYPWKSEVITPEICKQNQVVYNPNWFVDDNGKPVTRNAFDFLKDHLGYRIELQNIKIAGQSNPGSTARITMNLKNYGFAAAFCMQSGFAILDSEYKPVTEVNSGDPSKWYSHNPKNFKDTKILEYTLNASITLPSKPGKYYVAFYLRNSMGQYASLSNRVETADGYVILQEFDL